MIDPGHCSKQRSLFENVSNVLNEEIKMRDTKYATELATRATWWARLRSDWETLCQRYESGRVTILVVEWWKTHDEPTRSSRRSIFGFIRRGPESGCVQWCFQIRLAEASSAVKCKAKKKIQPEAKQEANDRLSEPCRYLRRSPCCRPSRCANPCNHPDHDPNPIRSVLQVKNVWTSRIESLLFWIILFSTSLSYQLTEKKIVV